MASLQLTGVIPFIVSLLLYIFIGPVFIVLLLLNELARFIVSIYLYLKYDSEVALVPDGNDGAWACKKPGMNRTVVARVKVGPGLDFESLVCLLDDMMAYKTSDGKRCYEKLEYILTTKCGYACWKHDELFSVRNHCRVLCKNTVCTEAEVKQIFKDLSEDPDESHPQWEFVLIPRYKEQGKPISTLMCVRFLHAYFDGLSINTLIKNMSSNYTPYFNPQEFKIPLMKRVLFYTSAVVFGPFASLRLLMNFSKSHWPTLQGFPEGQIERHFTWTPALSIDRIKQIKNGVKSRISVATIVENAFISAAIETLPRKRFPDEWGILQVVALVPYPNENPQNRFTGFIYSVNTLDDDFTRLEKTTDDVNEGFTGPTIPLAYALAKLGGRLPIPTLEYALRTGGVSAMIYSNLPGSRTRATLKAKNKVEILEILAYPPQPNDSGISVLGFAYENRLTLSVSALSNWLTKEEVELIVAKIPGVIESWAAKADKLQD